MILLSPILFETERAQMIEMEKSQKQRVSLFALLLFFFFQTVETNTFMISYVHRFCWDLVQPLEVQDPNQVYHRYHR